ncbi:integumentary mucin A.1-like isoform X2 [Haliotis cracherodii]|uniref:integumentary mucin A.1-like isoform X2 n=1 Tax=Haliotis cracherodii TaxID=6455 RepID=UPI0039E99843
MSKMMNAKTQSDMHGKGSSGDENGDMTAEQWGEVYDMLCAKIKADDAYAKIRSKMRKLTESKKVAPKKTIKKTQKKKTSKPAAAAASTTTTAAVATTAATATTTTTITTAPVTTTAATAAADSETKGTSFLKPATPATPAKRRPRKKLSLKISHQEQLIDRTPDVSSAQSVLEQWWEQTPREPTYSPNAPVMMTTGDSDDHEALKLATLLSMDLDTPTLLDASWSPASPEDFHVFSSGRP